MLLRRYHDRRETEASDTTSDAPTDTRAGATDGPEDTKPPARSASKAEWVAYAVASGANQDDTEQLTKEQLVTEYGG